MIFLDFSSVLDIQVVTHLTYDILFCRSLEVTCYLFLFIYLSHHENHLGG